MDLLFSPLFATIIKRPYVFVFLIVFLFLALRLWGYRRAFMWLVSGYAIAWVSEYVSIHLGFPYGAYHYLYENLHGELIVGGVPFFDSLSYPFLIFAGYTTALFALQKNQTAIIFLGACFTMFLDVIIDPVANQGEKWFLGKIYNYAHEGVYFGVPWSNFAGWFIVPLAVILFNSFLWRKFPDIFKISDHHDTITPLHHCVAFYFGIALFNIAIAFAIKDNALGCSGLAVAASVALTICAFRCVLFRQT